MLTCRWHSTRLLVVLGIALSTFWSGTSVAAESPVAKAKPQIVVLFPGRSLVERRLPVFMQIQPGKFLAARVVQQACTTPQLKSDSLLMFLPDSHTCVQLEIQDRISLRRQLHQLTGRWPMSDPLVHLDTQPFLVFAPAHDTSDLARLGLLASCTCPDNTAPTGSVMCTAQTRTADTPIGTVTFVANDADGDSLSEAFSYQRDAGPVQPGLPSSLTSSCVAVPAGTLQCTINGSAPGPAGIVQLNVDISDGMATLPLNSLIEVLAAFPDRIFADGYEYPGCP